LGYLREHPKKIIKKVSTSKLLATAFGRDGEGAVFTPGGRYDKSAAVQAHYVQGMRSFALDEVESAKTQVAVALTVQSAAPATKTEAQRVAVRNTTPARQSPPSLERGCFGICSSGVREFSPTQIYL
jgi:hypothetical protein